MPLDPPANIIQDVDDVDPVSYPCVSLDWELAYNPDAAGENVQQSTYLAGSLAEQDPSAATISHHIVHGQATSQPLLWQFQANLIVVDDVDHLAIQTWVYTPTQAQRFSNGTVSAEDPDPDIPVTVEPNNLQDVMMFRLTDLGTWEVPGFPGVFLPYNRSLVVVVEQRTPGEFPFESGSIWIGQVDHPTNP